MKKWGILLLVVTLCVPGVAIHAQDESDDPVPDRDPWPVIARCVGPATVPPEGWTYPGVILLEGYAGLHGVSAEWKTPRVVAFNAYGGNRDSLSPDGLWYAVPQYTVRQQEFSMDTSIYTINDIHVYSTISPREVVVVPWQAKMYIFRLNRGTSPHLRWRDNQHFIYQEGDTKDGYAGQVWLFDPFNDEITPWNGMPEAATHQYAFYPSPDWSRAVADSGKSLDWRMFDPMTGESLETLPQLSSLSFIMWSLDSTRFVVTIWEEQTSGNELYKLSLFDNDGNFQTKIYESSEIVYTVNWSYDGRYISFEHSRPIENQSTPRLYLADIENELVIDTCFALTPGAWSPTGLQLALMPPGSTDRPIYVFDLQDWALYTVAWHSGTIIGWRE